MTTQLTKLFNATDDSDEFLSLPTVDWATVQIANPTEGGKAHILLICARDCGSRDAKHGLGALVLDITLATLLREVLDKAINLLAQEES